MTKTIRKTDPRITRTLKLLGDALRELIVERGYDTITVQDITDRADVSRTTFYLHFKDKDELLFATMRQIYDELTGSYRHRVNEAKTWEELEQLACETSDYDHVAQNADFYRVMLGKHGSAAFIQQIMNYLTEETLKEFLKPILSMAPQVAIPPEIIASFFAGAEIGLMNWWLQNDMRYTAEQMAKMQYQLAIGGLQGVMGMMNTTNPPSLALEE